MKTKFILFIYLFIILITLFGLHNTHVLNYTRNINKKISDQTLENILKFIFKVVIKHQKMREFCRKCYLENEPFLRKH